MATKVGHSRLARFAAITALAFVLSRTLGLVREQVINARFAPGSVAADAYTFAFLIPDILFVLASGGALGAGFIPVFTKLRRMGEEDAAWRMASGVLAVVGVAAGILVTVCWIFAPVLIKEGIARQAERPETQELAVTMMRILLLSPLLLALATVVTVMLQSFDKFAVPAFAPVAYNTCIILGALVLAPVNGLGVRGVAIGVVIGAYLFLAMQLPSARRLGLRLPRSWPLADSNVRQVFALLLPRMVGQSAVHVSTIVSYSLAAGLGTGPSAAYRSALVIFALPVGLFGTSMATVAFPALSREAGGGDMPGFLYLLRRAIRGILFFVLPASVGLLLLREPIVKLLYERGNFKPAQTVAVADPLLYLSLGIAAYAMLDVLPRAFYALQDSRTPVKIALGAVALKIGLSLLLIRVLGLGGLALAFSLSMLIQVALLTRALSRRTGPIIDGQTQDFLLRAAAATAIMAAMVLIARPLLLSGYQDMSFLNLVARLGVTLLGAVAVYIGVSTLLGQEEVGTLRRIVRR